MREQFLVEIDTGGEAGIESLGELNRLFTAWCHQQYHRAVHTETDATPAQRYHGADRVPAPRPASQTLLRIDGPGMDARVAPAVDITLLSRFYERFADHAVEVAKRVIYQATGKPPRED